MGFQNIKWLFAKAMTVEMRCPNQYLIGMKIIGSIDGSSKANPCEIGPNQHRGRRQGCVDEVCVKASKDNHEHKHDQ